MVLDAFHYLCWRGQWDSRTAGTSVDGGAPCPSVGAITCNPGRRLLAPLVLRTGFVQYDPPRLAAAAMVGRAFPFARWAASMRHRDTGAGQSVLIYVYTFDSFDRAPRPLRRALEPVVAWLFAWQTRRRFARLAAFIASHGGAVAR